MHAGWHHQDTELSDNVDEWLPLRDVYSGISRTSVTSHNLFVYMRLCTAAPALASERGALLCRRILRAGVQWAAGAALASRRARRHPGPHRLLRLRARRARAAGGHRLAGMAATWALHVERGCAL